jgi:hypothetical protein
MGMRTKKSKQRYIFILFFLALVAVGLLAWKISTLLPPFVSEEEASSANTASFMELAARTYQYSSEQQAALSVTATKAEIQNTCYEYPEPDNESFSLWCGSSVKKTISIQPDAQFITVFLQRLDPVMARESMAISTHAGSNITVDAIVYEADASGRYTSPTCGITITHFPDGNTPKAVKDPSHIIYELSCRARSNSLVPGYKYIDNPGHIFSRSGPAE